MRNTQVEKIASETISKHGLPGFVFAEQDVYEQEKDKVFAFFI